MKSRFLIATILCATLWTDAIGQIKDLDNALSDMVEDMAAKIKDSGLKKIAVVDFTDLSGNPKGDLGKYIAEKLTVNFVLTKRPFSLLDRGHLKRIMQEHKLTATGLVNPENAKKLGMFAGVDAFIFGTIIPKGAKVEITGKTITTETGEIPITTVAEFKNDEFVKDLMSHAGTDGNAGSGGAAPSDDGPVVTKSFGDLGVELQSLKVGTSDQLLLTMSLINKNPKKNIWVALSTDNGGRLRSLVTDSNGVEFQSTSYDVSGVAHAWLQYGGFFAATEIRPGDSISTTVKYFSRDRRNPTPGSCRFQMEVLLGYNFDGKFGPATLHNLVAKIEAN